MNKRIDWIDAAKGYGILLVILGHLELGMFSEWIYTFHIPLFFFLSGYVFSTKHNFFEFLKRKCKALLVPYFLMGLILIIFQVLFYHMPGENFFVDFFTKFKDLIIQIRCWDLWYIACLFWLNIFFYLIVKLFRKLYIILPIVIAIAIYGVYYYTNIRKGLFWNIDACMIVVPFFFVGYAVKIIVSKSLLKNLIDRINKNNAYINKVIQALIFIAALTINYTASVYSYSKTGLFIDIYNASLGYEPMFYTAAFAGILFSIIFSIWLSLKPIKYIGRNSLVYYIYHMDMMMPVFERIFPFDKYVTDYIGSPAFWMYKISEFVFLIITLTLINELVIKTKLKVILGNF